jgi:hypothetical protein
MNIPAKENPSPRKGFHPCPTCLGWGSYSSLMEHGYGMEAEPGDPAPMFDVCPRCDGDKWIEEQMELPL